MLWIALYVVLGLVGLVVLMAVIGLALPRDHVAARRASFAKPPAEIWRAITDLDAQPAWRTGVKKIERLSPTSFRETSSQGAITYAIDVDDAATRRITRIADEHLPFGGRWIYELAPDGSGTRLTITEDGFVKNPVFRFLSKTVFSQAATLERFIADLGVHFGDKVSAEPSDPSPLVKSRDGVE